MQFEKCPSSFNKIGLLYDEMNNEIFNIHNNKNKDYSLFENKASLSIISENTFCKRCNSNYSFITCNNCLRKTCAKSECCTLYEDYHGYISICKSCELTVLKKLKPCYDFENEKNIYAKEISKDIKLLSEIRKMIKN